jgi:hypothetical protein
MTSQTPRLFREIFGLTAATALLFGPGCGSEPEPEPKREVRTTAPTVTTTAPAAPTVVSVEELMNQYGIDSRVQLTEERAPDTTEQRIAVLRFFDAFARADANALSGMLSPTDALLLERMVSSGAWDEATEGIVMIDVQTGSHPIVGDCALALFMVGSRFEPQLWSYTISGDPALSGGSSFDALPCPPDMVNRLSGDDWISAWLKILEDELARASEPDEIVEISSTDLSEDTQNTSSSGSMPSGGGGGGPGRKRPTGPKVDPNPFPSGPNRR